MIQVKLVSKSYDSSHVIQNISFHVKKGESFGIIGPNGSGKSTLLKLCSGIEKAEGGTIQFANKEIHTYSRKHLAKWVAVLQQEALPPVGFSVREVVEMGRYPYQNWMGTEEKDPEHLIVDILEKLEIKALQNRSLEQLSGGERQRVALGKVMAQQPQILMLDEPTTYLDIGHQLQMMEYIREWQQQIGLTVISVLHDLNLAAMYCDRLLLLHEGRLVKVGTAAEIINQELISQVYGTEPTIISHPQLKVPQILLNSDRVPTTVNE
ncbi:heme ABC transporter ATP-binding protein [Chengkuizengella axinellae]|uniref:Heme ABC transporter ATP-binding protein n=1 Tax=Chengkuizengella axinellae TaxID=3064388 RepID=A0ABT9J0S3_9BACL|nr:heme ABC transporter ATP-binding protein [Chengkuizengella sp. 2205SS18-9]MDP5275214.1 heme ABC transporter ATP-binding protein [Chengkuizengella sp. 2205SS18-9]